MELVSLKNIAKLFMGGIIRLSVTTLHACFFRQRGWSFDLGPADANPEGIALSSPAVARHELPWDNDAGKTTTATR